MIKIVTEVDDEWCADEIKHSNNKTIKLKQTPLDTLLSTQENIL